ncbi:hypothetical protein MMC25_001518 [Agyrium rufum]|nr:hypothetical protein [Agyrium rufum]
METTFISIHDLSLDARLLYVSNSIVDILGYTPEEVVGKSCWEYFHPDEIPFARAVHGRGVELDKAACLNYCQVKNKEGYWIGCECVFTIVHDVMVASTSIYRRGMKASRRAAEAPIVRRLFSSSPRDPRYHMLQYISAKFTKPPKQDFHEPRAALFLNRFTRTLTIMYATNGLEKLLGVHADDLTNKSFYYCIQENCLQEAVKCLESAKANDSIAYLRFWFRDPRTGEEQDDDESMSDIHSVDQDEDGGVHLDGQMDLDGSEVAMTSTSESVGSPSREPSVQPQQPEYLDPNADDLDPNSRSSSGNSCDLNKNTTDAIFDHSAATPRSSASSLPTPEEIGPRQRSGRNHRQPIELEAVVSCTSDGLVVILRGAKAFYATNAQASATADNANTNHNPAITPYRNGLFASPWALDPIIPEAALQGTGFDLAAIDPASRSGPIYAPSQPQAMAAGTPIAQQGPPSNSFMETIREVAVFAWSLTGINGSLASYGRGLPSGESQPPGGFPIWDPDGSQKAKENSGGYDNRDDGEMYNGYAYSTHRRWDEDYFSHGNGDPGGRHDTNSTHGKRMNGINGVHMNGSAREHDLYARSPRPPRWSGPQNQVYSARPRNRLLRQSGSRAQARMQGQAYIQGLGLGQARNGRPSRESGSNHDRNAQSQQQQQDYFHNGNGRNGNGSWSQRGPPS